MPTTSIIIPSYRRPGHLAHCLTGVAEQHRLPDEVIVVRRDDDHETAALISDMRSGLREVVVKAPGVVAAMIAGANSTHSALVGFLDDDAYPSPEWLDRVVAHFADPRVGAVGGRDIVPNPVQKGPPTKDVGRLSQWGRLIGNHHLGTGGARDVDVLKGANFAFRSAALALPDALRGTGAQVHYEVATCLWARSRGWRLVYDPSITVAHEIGPRFDADRRERPESSAIADAAENLVFSMLSLRRDLLWRRALYGVMVGDRGTPGLARASLAAARREEDVLVRLGPSLRGQGRALARIMRGERVSMTSMT